MITNTIKIADEMIIEGNKLLKSCVNKMVPQLFMQGQEKVEVGLKRKSELNDELGKLENKKKKLSLL